MTDVNIHATFLLPGGDPDSDRMVRFSPVPHLIDGVAGVFSAQDYITDEDGRLNGSTGVPLAAMDTHGYYRVLLVQGSRARALGTLTLLSSDAPNLDLFTRLAFAPSPEIPSAYATLAGLLTHEGETLAEGAHGGGGSGLPEYPALTITGGTTLDLTVVYVEATFTSGGTITLPLLDGASDKHPYLLRVNRSTSGNATIQPTGGDTIGGTAALVLPQSTTTPATLLLIGRASTHDWVIVENLNKATVMPNPMITNGDSVYGGALGVPVRIAPGQVDYVSTRIAGNAIGWRAPQPAFADPPFDVPTSGSYIWPSAQHYLILPALTGNLTITLPSAYDAYVLSMELLAKARALNGHTVTFVNPDGAIDAGSNYVLSNNYGWVRFVPNVADGVWYTSSIG